MKLHQGVWLPDHETHLIQWMNKAGELVDGKGTYQIGKLRLALSFCKQFRTAIDVGGHCGLWSMQLAKQFAMVHAFEPVAAHRECFATNMPESAPPHEWELHACALGEVDGSIKIHTAPTSSGDSWVDGEGDIPMRRLDDFALTEVDFVKLDCEGYEMFALLGGQEMLMREKPVVIVEQKPGRAQKFGLAETGAVTFLQDLGARLVRVVSGDYILVWP